MPFTGPHRRCHVARDLAVSAAHAATGLPSVVRTAAFADPGMPCPRPIKPTQKTGPKAP